MALKNSLPIGLRYDGCVRDLDVVSSWAKNESAGDPLEELRLFKRYVEEVKAIMNGEKSLWKVQTVETTLREFMLPTDLEDDEAEILFHLEDIYKDRSNVSGKEIGGGRSVRSINKIDPPK